MPLSLKEGKKYLTINLFDEAGISYCLRQNTVPIRKISIQISMKIEFDHAFPFVLFTFTGEC